MLELNICMSYIKSTLQQFVHKTTFHPIQLNKGLSTQNWTSDFQSSTLKAIVLTDFILCLLCKNAWTTQVYRFQETILAFVTIYSPYRTVTDSLE